MISYQAYKILHLVGVFMVLLSLGGLVVLRGTGQEKSSPWWRLGAATNGIGLLLSLVAGFGLVARLGVGWPGWVLVKILIWLVLGGMVAVLGRAPESGRAVWWTALVLAAAAAYLANIKPF